MVNIVQMGEMGTELSAIAERGEQSPDQNCHRIGGSACGGGGSLELFDELAGGVGGCDR